MNSRYIAFLLLSFILAGCTATATIALPVSPAPPVAPRLTASSPIPTRAPELLPPTETPLPSVDTLLSSNADCSLPCIWGFVPGQTTADEVSAFFLSLGWGGRYFDMPLGPVYYTGKDFPSSSIRFGFHVEDERVSAISYSLTRPQFEDRDEFLSPQAVTGGLAIPDAVWVSLATGLEVLVPSETAFSLYLFFQPHGTLIHYAGVARLQQDEYVLCISSPLDGRGSYVESVTVLAGIPGTSRPKDLTAPFGGFGGMLQSQQALGLSPEEVVTSFQDEPKSCFTTPLSAWDAQP